VDDAVGHLIMVVEAKRRDPDLQCTTQLDCAGNINRKRKWNEKELLLLPETLVGLVTMWVLRSSWTLGLMENPNFGATISHLYT